MLQDVPSDPQLCLLAHSMMWLMMMSRVWLCVLVAGAMTIPPAAACVGVYAEAGGQVTQHTGPHPISESTPKCKVLLNWFLQQYVW